MAASVALDAAALAVAGTACVLAGRAAQRARLPQITGFLVAGIAAGPAGFGLISARLLARLAPVEAACLGAIALAAGAELHLSELQRTRRQVGLHCTNPFPLHHQRTAVGLRAEHAKCVFQPGLAFPCDK